MFSRLMLGEGVLQIIIQAVDSDEFASHLVVFALSFLILSMTQYIAFHVVPYEVEDHAFRKSRVSAILV